MFADGDDASQEPRFIERMDEAQLREFAHDPEDLEWLRRLGVARRSPLPCAPAAA